MDKFDEEVTNFLIYNEVMKNSNNTSNKPGYSGSKETGCSSPAIAAGCVALAIIGWVWLIGKSCVSCISESRSESSRSYAPRHSYSHSYSSRSYSSGRTYSSRSSSGYRSSHTYSSHSSRKTTSGKASDPYNAGDYYHAEDFYEDNYDDFWDYEDAEDYYNEHSGD